MFVDYSLPIEVVTAAVREFFGAADLWLYQSFLTLDDDEHRQELEGWGSVLVLTNAIRGKLLVLRRHEQVQTPASSRGLCRVLPLRQDDPLEEVLAQQRSERVMGVLSRIGALRSSL